MINNRKIIYKSLTFENPNHLTSINFTKAKYGYKNDYITLMKNGYCIIDFLKFKNDPTGRDSKGYSSGHRTLDVDSKSTFIVGIRVIGEIMSLDIKDPNGFDKSFLYEDIEMKNELNIKSENGKYTLSLKSEAKNTKYFNFYETDMTYSQMFQLIYYVNYLYPFMMGWHAIGHPASVENDLINESRF